GMSESSLLRAFKQATARAPTQYLLELRLRRARHLLRYTRLNVTEIAFQTGFNDSNYFARQFRKGVGTSPREYRRQSTPGNHRPALQ
ncbi:MAG: helix-turn-helix transcriptional regulator, partial [Verrucomicrobia bacterium]|nr:helix-turn-helix transcriptional regulator [Verrucomicrobiota bacterium]